jgi:type II secretion system protein I
LPGVNPRKARKRGFTLAEALAALAFLAIVIPVAVEGLRVANLAGQVADRKALAMRVADRMLNQVVVERQHQSSQGGMAQEGNLQFRWQLQSDNWSEQAIKLLTVRVYYTVQGQEYNVQLSTLIDTTVTQ